ncbi:MAG: TolC family protein [Bdellovibrionales bacterium]|nr:TolC family protein [Bdellovibrionales bacterium]
MQFIVTATFVTNFITCTLISVFAATVISATAHAQVYASQTPADTFSLAEAISTAIANNPNQKANLNMVEAAHDEAEAYRKNSFLPSTRIYSGISGNGLGPSANTEGGYFQSAGWSASQMVYDGGARRHREKALTHEARAIEAEFNSSNSFIPNTSGALASDVFMTYLDASSVRLNIEVASQYVELFDSIALYITDPITKLKVDNLLIGYRSKVNSAIQNYDDVKRDLENFLYAPLPSELDSIEQTNARMQQDLAPYNDLEYAIAVAKEKNQNYLARLYQLQAAEENSASVKADLTRPKVAVVVADSWNRNDYYDGDLDNYHTRDGYIGVDVQYQIQFGTKSALSASRKRVMAAKQYIEQTTHDLVYRITSNYQKLVSADQAIADYQKNIDSIFSQIEEFRRTHTQPGLIISSDDFDFLTSLTDELDRNYDQYYNSLFSAVQYRYNLLREIGILFETTDIKPSYTKISVPKKK